MRILEWVSSFFICYESSTYLAYKIDVSLSYCFSTLYLSMVFNLSGSTLQASDK